MCKVFLSGVKMIFFNNIVKNVPSPPRGRAARAKAGMLKQIFRQNNANGAMIAPAALK